MVPLAFPVCRRSHDLLRGAHWCRDEVAATEPEGSGLQVTELVSGGARIQTHADSDLGLTLPSLALSYGCRTGVCPALEAALSARSGLHHQPPTARPPPQRAARTDHCV